MIIFSKKALQSSLVTQTRPRCTCHGVCLFSWASHSVLYLGLWHLCAPTLSSCLLTLASFLPLWATCMLQGSYSKRVETSARTDNKEIVLKWWNFVVYCSLILLDRHVCPKVKSLAEGKIIIPIAQISRTMKKEEHYPVLWKDKD